MDPDEVSKHSPFSMIFPVYEVCFTEKILVDLIHSKERQVQICNKGLFVYLRPLVR